MELLFHLCRVLALRQAEPVREPYNVRIADHCGLAVQVADYKVGCLSSDTRELDKLFYTIRYGAAVYVIQHSAHLHDILCLGVV